MKDERSSNFKSEEHDHRIRQVRGAANTAVSCLEEQTTKSTVSLHLSRRRINARERGVWQQETSRWPRLRSVSNDRHIGKVCWYYRCTSKYFGGRLSVLCRHTTNPLHEHWVLTSSSVLCELVAIFLLRALPCWWPASRGETQSAVCLNPNHPAGGLIVICSSRKSCVPPTDTYVIAASAGRACVVLRSACTISPLAILPGAHV